MSPPLTLDKLKDKRFYETEKAIFQSVTKDGAEEIGKILVAAKISRATFYRHHRAVHLIGEDYEGLVEVWIQGRVRGERRDEVTDGGCGPDGARGRVADGRHRFGEVRGDELRRMYFDILVFIYRNREVFQYFLMKGNTRVYNILMREMKPVVIGAWRAGWMGSAYDIYAGEVGGVLTRWGGNGYAEEEMMVALEDIMYLTETAKERLGRFAR